MEMTEKTEWMGLIQLNVPCNCHCFICSLLMNKIKEQLFEVPTLTKKILMYLSNVGTPWDAFFAVYYPYNEILNSIF